jgi:hypothetical protein
MTKKPNKAQSKRVVRGGGAGRHPSDSKALRPAPSIFNTLFGSGYRGNMKGRNATERPKKTFWGNSKRTTPGKQNDQWDRKTDGY